MLRPSFFAWAALTVICTFHARAQTPAAKNAAPKTGAAANKPSDEEIRSFEELLTTFKKFPQFNTKDNGGPYRFEAVKSQILRRLSGGVISSRILRFNRDFILHSNDVQRRETQLVDLQKNLAKIPVSDFDKRSLLEVKLESSKSHLEQARLVLFSLSIEANESIQAAMSTLSAEQLKVEEMVKAPKMPGVFGGSASDRMKLKEIEKINLTPVDPEFYETQVGKKMEKDLGGRAEFWSYNYDQDEMYVKVNNEMGKLRVIKDQSGIRFIQTRAGYEYMEPKGSDEKVDMNVAKGKFLTGDAREESLFGDFPKKRPQFLDEKGTTHSEGDGHKHDH